MISFPESSKKEAKLSCSRHASLGGKTKEKEGISIKVRTTDTFEGTFFCPSNLSQ